MVRPPYEGAPVKIGFSTHIDKRLRALQTGIAGELVVVRLLDGRTAATERWLHDHFSHLRISREWFEFDQEMLVVTPPPEEEPSEIEDGADDRGLISSKEYAGIIKAALSHAISMRRDAQGVAAKKIGCSTKTVVNILSGAYVPSGTVLIRMMAAYPEVDAAIRARPLVAHWRRVNRALAALEVAKQEIQKDLDALGIDYPEPDQC